MVVGQLHGSADFGPEWNTKILRCKLDWVGTKTGLSPQGNEPCYSGHTDVNLATDSAKQK
jgi:hypothetical protein